MADRRQTKEEAGTREAKPPPSGLTAEQFTALPEFGRFKTIMRRLLAVPKSELDRKVRAAKNKSLRVGNPNAPGRKPKPKQ